MRCPSCLRKLKERCANCSRPLDQAWTICPYCEADVPGVSSPRVRRRRSGPVEEELAPAYEHALAGEEATEPALANGDSAASAATAAERRSERRAAERHAAGTARAAAAGRRPRPAP